MEIWLHGFAVPGKVAELAKRAEEWGFTGLLIADSQSLTADVWVELALAAGASTRLRLGPGVSNPVTRHLAVTASAAATLQAETGGRAVLGLARGDSALTQIGLRAQPPAEFERSLERLQGLLRGEQVDFGTTAGSIRWLHPRTLPKVPVHVAASGARVIAAAARHVEGVDLTVGAEVERLRWGMRSAREAGPESVSVGAYVNVAVDPDRNRARALVRGSVATFARFSAGPGAGLSGVIAGGVREAARGYDTHHHGEAAHTHRLEAEFIDRFALTGPADHVARRLADIAAIGIERVIVVPGSLDSDEGDVLRSNERFARYVLPRLAALTK
jgi:5,10-methylenetetrahydromethanopterin reductase